MIETEDKRIEAAWWDRLEYLTDDIRHKNISPDKKNILLERKGKPPQVIELLRSQTKKGAGRAYYKCPLCGDKVSILYYPYAGLYWREAWQCRKCFVHWCGDMRIIKFKGVQEPKMEMYILGTVSRMYSSNGSNGQSHRRLTNRILHLWGKTGLEVTQAVRDGIDGNTLIPWELSEESAKMHPIWRELHALLHLRNRIISGELPYSKDAVKRALAQSHGEEKE